MKNDSALEKKSSNLSFTPKTDSFEAKIFLNWSLTSSSCVSGAGYVPALMTVNQQLQIQTVNDEFLYLLNYQEENELLGKSALLLGPSHKELTTPGERFAAIKKKDGDLVVGFLKIKSRSDILIINFQQISIEKCSFSISQDNSLIEIDNPSFLDGIEPPLTVDHVLPSFYSSFDINTKQYLTLRKPSACWPVQISCDENRKYTMVTFPSIGGLLIVSRNDLIIASINDDFSKAIIGYCEAELIGKDLISILPNIFDCLNNMAWVPLSSVTVSSDKKEMFCTPRSHNLDLFHKDGGIIKVSVQCRNFEVEGKTFLAIWLGYYRDGEEVDQENVFSPTLVLGRKKSYHDVSNAIISKNSKPIKFPDILQKSKNLEIEDFDEVKSLGEGAFSFIKLCVHKEDPSKTPIVIKYVVRSRILTWTREYQDIGPRIPIELAVLLDLRQNPHQHIPALQAHFSDDFYYCLIFDYYPTFDLFELLERKNELSLDEIRSILKQTCSAINHLHSLGIVHRDIKDENILIDNNGHITLIDFGSAHYISKGPFLTFYGTKLFCAPEILQGHPYEGRPQDVWQLGCLLYILIFRQNPFYSVEDILNCNIIYPFELDDQLSDLLQSLFRANENIRFTVTDMMSHEWMTKA